MELKNEQEKFVNDLKSKKDRDLVKEVLEKNNSDDIFDYIKKMFNDGKDENEKVAGYTGMFRRTRRRRMLKILKHTEKPNEIISMLGNYFSSSRTHFTRTYERNRLRKFLTVCESLIKIGFDPLILVEPINNSPKQRARGPLLIRDHIHLATNETYNTFRSDQVVKRLYRARKSEKKLRRYAAALGHFNQNHRAEEFFDVVDQFKGNIDNIKNGDFLTKKAKLQVRRGTMVAPKVPHQGKSNEGEKEVGFQLPSMDGEIPAVGTKDSQGNDP